jgi:hypothetical protein
MAVSWSWWPAAAVVPLCALAYALRLTGPGAW